MDPREAVNSPFKCGSASTSREFLKSKMAGTVMPSIAKQQHDHQPRALGLKIDGMHLNYRFRYVFADARPEKRYAAAGPAKG